MSSKADTELVKGIMQGSLKALVDALAAGADIESPDVHGFTGFPLRVACSLGHRILVLELLRRGAQVNTLSKDGPAGPLRMAKRGKHDDIVALLIKYGAKPLEESPKEEKPATPAPAVRREVPQVVSPPAESSFVLDAPAFDVPASKSTPEEVPVLPEAEPEIEHVLIAGCYGVDTSVLDGDLLRMSQSDKKPENPKPEDDRQKTEKESKGIFKFWNR